MGTPVLGVQGGAYPAQGTWSFSMGWRYQKSDRHFVGSEYQAERDHESSQVINSVNLADLSIRYQATRRIELSAGVPYFMGTRSQPLRNAQREIIERYQTQARGIGDIVVSARRWMFDPDTHLGANLQLGLGVKLPTGTNNVTDSFRVFSSAPAPNGSITSVIRTVDQSIQPGDGGFGILADFSTFKGLAGGNVSIYASGAYLANPQGRSEVLTYRGAPGEQVMSIADQYLLRAGAAFPIPKSKRLSFSAGIRVEGVPVRDLLGPDDGFRRPGVAVSIEPAINIINGKHVVTFGIPFAIYRNRFVSVADEARGAHGDAAFADYLVMAGYSRRF
ncbi:MAG TPA: hypothetical protein VK886_23185 [Vicinamibacterales bacterium]|nr:hypothetical protein [Vicinamibacterales bacterium]